MQEKPIIAEPPQKRGRPCSITLLALIVLFIALTGFVRMHQAIIQWSYLSSLQTVHPAYILSTGLFWGTFGLVAGLLLWLGWGQAGLLALGFLASYLLYFWIDRIFISASPERFVNWPFLLAVDLLGLAWAVWVIRRAKARRYFADTDTHAGSRKGDLDGKPGA